MSGVAAQFRERLDAFAVARPRPGVSYAEVLDVDEGPGMPRWRKIVRGVGGSLLGVVTFALVTPLVGFALMGLFWVLAGSPGDFPTFYAGISTFASPWGMLAAHLGLAMLIPISMALYLVVHRVHPRWLHSALPGVRWRYLLACLLVAAVLLNAVLLLSVLGQPFVVRPQDGFWWFLVVIVASSPLQAAAEEYFFRGYLLQALHPAGWRGPWFGVVASAAVFALFHGTQNLPLFLDRFGFGILAGVLVVRTGGLEAAIGAHIVNNVCAFVYAGLTSTIAEVKATKVISWVDAGWDLIGFGAYTVAAIWVARRMQVATTTPSQVRTVGRS